MGLFNDPKEAVRKNNLKIFEDKRIAFAEKLQKQGFAPEEMLFVQTPNGGFAALAEFNKLHWIIVSPGFGTDEDYIIESFEEMTVETEDFFVASEGMAGVLGMGKKGQTGFKFHITLKDGSVAVFPVICGDNSSMLLPLKKNVLLSTKRRRGNASIVWDMRPIEKKQVLPIVEKAEQLMGIKK